MQALMSESRIVEGITRSYAPLTVNPMAKYPASGLSNLMLLSIIYRRFFEPERVVITAETVP